MTNAFILKIISGHYSYVTELHVDHQELEPDQNVVFDPRSCSHLKKLRTLNTANNQMVDLQPLDLITSLYQLNISHNLLQDLQAVIDILTRIPGLKVGTMNPSLWFDNFFAGNRISKKDRTV